MEYHEYPYQKEFEVFQMFIPSIPAASMPMPGQIPT